MLLCFYPKTAPNSINANSRIVFDVGPPSCRRHYTPSLRAISRITHSLWCVRVWLNIALYGEILHCCQPFQSIYTIVASVLFLSPALFSFHIVHQLVHEICVAGIFFLLLLARLLLLPLPGLLPCLHAFNFFRFLFFLCMSHLSS